MTKNDTDNSFQSAVDRAKGYETLGPGWFAARDFVEAFMKGAEAEPFEKIAKKFSDQLYSDLLDAFQNWIISNTESNLQSHIYYTVDNIVDAILGGNEWALTKYVTGKFHNHQRVREAIARLIPAEIQDGRIADLEKEVAHLKDILKMYR